MAGITDAEFLNKVIPFGFDTATLGGYSLDAKTIEASEKIIKRGRNEFHFSQDEIVNHIEKEVNLIKKQQEKELETLRYAQQIQNQQYITQKISEETSPNTTWYYLGALVLVSGLLFFYMKNKNA